MQHGGYVRHCIRSLHGGSLSPNPKRLVALEISKKRFAEEWSVYRGIGWIHGK